MRKPVVFGVFLLSLLSFVTFVVTSLFITPLVVKAKQPRNRSGEAGHRVPRISLVLDSKRMPRPSASGRIHPAVDSQVNRTVSLLGARTEGNLVHLQASAALLDPRPGIKYVWWVRLFEGNKKERLFFDKLYTHQAFSVPAEGMKPTFEDVIALPVDPGRYLVDVGLLTFSPDWNLASERDKKLRNGDHPSGSAKIIVGN